MGWTALPSAVKAAIGAMFAVLLVASGIVAWLKRARPQRDWTELALRVRTWWIMAAIFAAAMIVSRATALLFFAFVSFLALKEYLSLIPTRRADRRVLFWAYLAIPVQFYWVWLEWYGMFIIFIPVYMFLLLPLRMITIGQTEGFLRAVGTLNWGLMTTVYCLSHTAFLLILRLNAGAQPQPGPGLVLFLVVLTEFNDVAQYVWGHLFGKRPIVPAISPLKTWEGFVGGVASTLVVATLSGPQLTPMNNGQSLIAGLIIGLAGFAGDVNISAVKRDLKIERSGMMLPGHGGILDRVNSLTYTAPLFFHYVYWLFPFHTHGAVPVPPP
jgi:phosphatidate cytidylyltransferase